MIEGSMEVKFVLLEIGVSCKANTLIKMIKKED